MTCHSKPLRLFLLTTLLALFLHGQVLRAQELPELLEEHGIKATTSFDFHGFAGVQFQLENSAVAKIVAPKHPAPGKPWVWRARFWGHQPALDLGLLKHGYHIAYCDVANLYGNATAVKRWDDFYALTQSLGFAPQPILEGMSRGGLIVFNWAKANPEKVSAIYGDNPVCDIRSWPGKSSPGDWKICLAAHSLKASDAADFRGNPIDGLKPLAEVNVPFFLVLGAEDKVVPIVDNGIKLMDRYETLGGKVQLWKKPGLDHHPHGLSPVTPLLNALLAATRQPETKVLPLDLLQGKKKILVLGDSITYKGQYVSHFASWAALEHNICPDCFINLGLPSETISGLSEAGHAGGRFPRPDLHERLERVLDKIQPDLIFSCYGMNCGNQKTLEPSRFQAYREGQEKLHATAAQRGIEIVFLTPPIFDPHVGKDRSYYAGVLHTYSHWLLTQQSQGWKVIDLHFPMQTALDAKRKETPGFKFQKDAVHPNEEGHQVMAEAWIRAFEPTFDRTDFASTRHKKKNGHTNDKLKATQRKMLTATKHLRPGIPGYVEK